MKTIKLTILFLFIPFTFFAQSLTGLWTGTLTNDSNTIRKDQSFEIVLTQYKDKVYGYSRMTFFVHDTLYYIVKRVKGTVEGEVCEVKDDEIISHNFPRKPDKGVKLISTFRRNKQDSIWYLDGDWKTTEAKRHGYYSISGKISLKPEADLEKSKIIPHLEELKLADDVAFYKESKKVFESVAAINPPAKDAKKEPLVKDSLSLVQAKSQPVVQTKQTINSIKKEQPVVEEKTVVTSVKNNRKDSLVIVQAKFNPSTQTSQPVNDSKKQSVIKEEKVPEKQEPKKSELFVLTKPDEQKKESIAGSANTATKKPESFSVAVKEKDKQQSAATIAEIKPVVPTAAVFVAERKVAPPQVVNFKSDSLELALYDNGEIDGDTVSVLLNGEIIIAKQGLKVSAIKKTIYVPAGTNDSMTLVLYAENLGKYPPNTGLLVVHDGDDVYQIRFSADLQQNAAVIFKRKRY